MIKRLKWNVLYDQSGEDDSSLSDGSDQSTESGSANVQAVLDELARNDPTLVSTPLGIQEEASSSEEDEEDNAEREQETCDDVEEAKYAEWRECQLCPGKHFLNDGEVELHLKSRRHAKAVRRMERLSTSEQNKVMAATGNSTTDDRSLAPADAHRPTHRSDVESRNESSREHEETRSVEMKVLGAPQGTEHCEKGQHCCDPERDATEDERRKVERRKAAVKRKLKALKRRKWEKQMKAEKTSKVAEDGKEAQQDILNGDNEVKDELGLLSRQQKQKQKGANRKMGQNTDIAGRERRAANDENEFSQQYKKSKANRKKRKLEQPRTQREDEEPQRKKTAGQKVGQRSSRDGLKRERKKEKLSG